ncbi:hypothetical protein GCM10009007_10920 [Formosimonas limnophila]|uniref:Uncharacterized protein n=1 Tax=Formosimonas limnophila TaxID=1384487 RepID=A0A8J3CMF8_9BURK|nr:hypothetical protein GCM10009007_10920 [Formosimonas limnophila]
MRAHSLIDADGYVKHGKQGVFHINSWTYVGAAMGAMSRDVARQTLPRFPLDAREKIDGFLQCVKPRL